MKYIYVVGKNRTRIGPKIAKLKGCLFYFEMEYIILNFKISLGGGGSRYSGGSSGGSHGGGQGGRVEGQGGGGGGYQGDGRNKNKNRGVQGAGWKK